MNERRFKFEGVAVVGERIRAYDFHERTDCYVEGVVTKVDSKGILHPERAACFVVLVDVDGWRGERNTDSAVSSRVGKTVFVPMEVAFMEWDGRIVNLSRGEE